MEYPRRIKLRKSFFTGIILTALLGPIGLFYSTIIGGILMTITSGIAAAVTSGASELVLRPICMILSLLTVYASNKNS